MEAFNPSDHYLRLSTACPEVVMGDIPANVENTSQLYHEAEKAGSALIVFPELGLTGYSIADTLQFRGLQKKAKDGLAELANLTTGKDTAMIVGLPLEVGNALYNCAAVLADGEVKGIVPKQNLPNYGEFYEKRWFQAWDKDSPNATVEIEGKEVQFGGKLLFDIGGVKTGVEICEDLWVTDPPSRLLAEHGAYLIANPSASPELVSKADYRRQLVGNQSARLMTAYAYAGCDSSESTMDVVMGGHQMIVENGRIKAERQPFTLEGSRLLSTDIDLDHLHHERKRDNNYPNRLGMTVVKCTVQRPQIDPEPGLVADPFLPSNENPMEHATRLQETFNITAMGLMQYLKKTGIERVVLGLSGGLDSTLALLIAVQAAHLMGKDPGEVITTLTMPGMGSSERTQSNAQVLARQLSIPNEVIPIKDIAAKELALIGHSGELQDTTYENVQARARTELLFNYANKNNGLVLGTGDLSENMLGWSTYNADNMSGYNPNVDIPKTQVRHMVRYIADLEAYTAVKAVLSDIIDTPVSPELVSPKDGEISQKTEELIGPYVLHEFFGTYLIRWGDEPAKVQFMAEKTFKDQFEPEEIAKWLEVFKTRYFRNRFKLVVMPPGPKVGSLAIDNRSNQRTPSDMSAAIWE